jgi:two-component system, cell cycle sensor histidine kinase and response regulator CckA
VRHVTGKAERMSTGGWKGDWLDQLPVAAVMLTADGVARGWNAEAADLLGWPESRAFQRLGEPGAEWWKRLRTEVAARGTGSIVITNRRGGRPVTLRLQARGLDGGDLLVVLHDETDRMAQQRAERRRESRRRWSEAALEASRRRLQFLTEELHDHAVFTIDDAGRIATWNESVKRVLGYDADALLNRPLASLQTGGTECVQTLLSRTDAAGRQAAADVELRHADGSTVRVHLVASAQRDPDLAMSGCIVVLRDLTERLQVEENLRRSEEQLRQAQKMDAIGRLAAGIAHDFNNILTAIQGHVQFLLEDLPENLPSRQDAEEVRRAAERATALTRQLLTFARRQVITPVTLDVNDVVREVDRLLRRLISADVRLSADLGEPLPAIFADPGQLEQVIVNLVVNARDAISDGGEITLRTSVIHLDESYTGQGLQLTPGEYVQLSVSDTGCGMSREVQRQVFEPFFTTKPEGTGLGLPTVYGIVKQSNGHISVYSEPGVGTTFKVFLPVHGQPVPAAATGTTPAVAAARHTAGTVLLVEDDDAVRGLVRRTLVGNGFHVLEARDGEEALQLATESDSPIDVVVTDYNMPNMSGDELAERLATARPDAGIVMMSGFPETALARNGYAPTRRRFLEKPFTPVSLVRAVREAMVDE